MSKPPSFVSRYLVSIIMVPSIIAFHFGWYWLQDNPALVGEDEKIDVPVVTLAKYLWKKLDGTETSTTPKVTAAKTENS